MTEIDGGRIFQEIKWRMWLQAIGLHETHMFTLAGHTIKILPFS
ncbi:hypothetical protein LCGC14_1082570 [marine sediment metagenome]|uniref:Uncharacterized protein n=1 Tax=marine sediment metagenome TaxID=412755 RepID=A0A0F9QKR9_9ZZZZ